MSKRPNILFVMMDQLRYDALGYTGGWVRTPHLDGVYARGISFDNCITAGPLCVPARTALATGLYAHCTGVWTNRTYAMPPETPTWMQAIRAAGYRTSLFGKTHLHPHRGDLREREHLLHSYGLDDVDEIAGPHASAVSMSNMTARWKEKGLLEGYLQYFHDIAGSPPVARPSTLPLDEYADVYVGQQAKKYIQQYDRQQPWFCWVSFGGPHEPWDAPEPYASMYDPATMPEPVNFKYDNPHRPEGHFDHIRRNQAAKSGADYKSLRANYAGNVTLIDSQIGEIISVVAERGELENTVIVLTTDHGEMNGDYGLVAKSNFLHSAAHIPLIISTPETAQSGAGGQRRTTPVELIDVGPTLVELAGGTIQHTQFGRSLCPVMADPAQFHRADAISELRGEIAIFDGRWQMAVNDSGETYFLFDLQEDPREERNLAGLPEAEEQTLRLKARLAERLVESLNHKEPK